MNRDVQKRKTYAGVPNEEDELIENIRRKIIYYGRSIKIRGRRKINYSLPSNDINN